MNKHATGTKTRTRLKRRSEAKREPGVTEMCMCVIGGIIDAEVGALGDLHLSQLDLVARGAVLVVHLVTLAITLSPDHMRT